MTKLVAANAVFPAYAGVFPKRLCRLGKGSCLPRIRGGVSLQAAELVDGARSSPHTRGCFPICCLDSDIQVVFPAYAGVFLICCYIEEQIDSLPRIRGGVSALLADGTDIQGSSPHTRGCFQCSIYYATQYMVFPAYAGVFLQSSKSSSGISSLPRIRGGVSTVLLVNPVTKESSPHTRGCFHQDAEDRSMTTVFPAYAGVFPI